ncbi:hypothetical protein Esti_005554 [Eimeria stiedai]
MLIQPTTALHDAESGSLLQISQPTTELEQLGPLDFNPRKDNTAVPDDVAPASMLQAAAQPDEFSFSTEATSDQQPSSSGVSPCLFLKLAVESAQLPQERKELEGVNITVNAAIVNGARTTQVAAYKQGSAVAVFNLASTTEGKERLLRDLSAVAENPDALFTLVWQPTSATAGKLYLRLESSYNANSSVPSVTFSFQFRHVAGRRLVSERVTASIAKESLLLMRSIGEFKQWLASACHPPLLKEGEGFQIVVMTLMLHQKSKKRFEVKGEDLALDWLQKVAVRKEPIVAVTGELERNAVIEVPFFQDFSWPQLLRLKGIVTDCEKSHVPLSSMSETIPSLRVEKFTVPPDWFRMTPQQQFEWWSSQPREAGAQPGQMNLSGLFGPHYPSATTPIFFIDNKGQPLGTESEPGNASLFGTRLTPVEKLPDHLFGQFVPALSATITFPGGKQGTHLINPSREWHKLEKSYPDLRAALAPKEPQKEGALLTVKINDTPYHLAGDFVESYPSLLHLLAHLASENPGFLLNSVELIFGASVPRSVNAIFVLETPEGVPPWCIFQFEVPITKRNTVLIKAVMKKARRAAESPNGCNITNAKGLRFETLTAVAKVEQVQPELKTRDRQQLNFRGSQAECRRMGALFSEAYKSGTLLAVFFSATHLLTGSVEIPRFSKSGQDLKPTMKTVSSRVHMNEPLPQLLVDFTKPFKKYRVPGMEFPYMQVSGGVEKSALPRGSLPESYYHQSPGKVKITWHPQFPILGDHDIFTDDNGPHQTGQEVNIPLRPGAAGRVGPFNAIQSWLRQHIPNLRIPLDLERMPAEDRDSFFKKIFVEVEGGEKINLYDILQPLLRSPRWDRFNPADYAMPYHLLTLPIKNVFVEGELEFVVSTPEGAQVSHTLPVRPQETWGSVLDRFYHMFPQYDRTATKLSLFDPAGNPISVPDESPVYVGVKEAVEQHRKGFEISLETPLGKFTTCYRFDEGANKCLVVPMHSLFCGKILGISERAKAWERQCSAADMRSRSVSEVQNFLENALRGADLFRPVRLRDLLALIRKHVASFRPDVIKNLNLPDPAATQVEIERLKVQIDKLRALPQKTAEHYDALQKYRRQIKTLMSKEVKWAAPSSLSFFYVKEKGVQRDLVVPIQDPNLRTADELWRVYHHATRQSAEAANLDFANVYNITFRVLGTGEREEVKRRIKHLLKEQKQAQKKVSQIKVKVNVSFEVENSEASADSNIEITIPADYATGLRIGGKRRTVGQIAKLYNIPKSYFTLENYPRVVVDPTRGPLPILKIALETVCLRPDKTIVVTPAELAGVLSERGGYAEDDLVLVTTATGEKLRVPLRTLRQLQPDKVQKFNFAWKRTLSDISSEAQAKRKEKVEAAFGEVCCSAALCFAGKVGDPMKWKELLAPWLLRLRSFGPLADTAIQLVVRNDREPNRAFSKSKCQVATFGELLEYINDFDSLLNACPGLVMVVSKRVPFAFDLGIRAPPPSGFRMWNRAHGDPEKNRRQLERLAAAFERVTGDTKVSWKFAKHSGTMLPEQIASIQALLQSDMPRDAALVRMILTSLNVPKEDVARLTGRLSILITHEPTESDKVLLREGLITVSQNYPCAYDLRCVAASVLCLTEMYIARADGTKLSRLISARGNPQTPVNINVSTGDYSISYSLFSPTKQVNGSPCSIRSASDFQNLTWGKALEWCGLKFEELAGLKSPFVWIEGSQISMFPNTQPGIPVVTFQNDYPMGFSFQRPGAPISSILPNDIYFNVVQQPGSNVPGATFIQRAPTPTGNIDTTFKYFGSDPQRWGPSLDPGTAPVPKGTTAEFSFYPDPDQEESKKAFSNPSIKSFKIPGYSHLPGLQSNFNVSFNPNMPSAPGGELVYIQAPAGNGQYFLCPGITLQQFLTLKSKEEVSKLCGIPPALLEADILVSAFAPVGSHQSHPVVLIDRVQSPHYYTAPWEDSPLKYIEPLLRGGHPEDLVLFSFANTNQCALSLAMLQNLKTWLELTRFCSETFKGVRPTHIVGVVQLKISMPEELKEKMMRRHNGTSPENIFAAEPLGVVISNLLVAQQPGVTLETILEMNDGTKFNFNTLPEEWRNIPATQIPGLASISIQVVSRCLLLFVQDTKVGNLQDLLKQLNIGGKTPFSQFVTKITEEGNSPRGFTVPSTQVRVGGPTTPGVPPPHIRFEMLQPETIGSSGTPESFGVRFPLAHGALPETMKMEDVLKMLHNPQVTVVRITTLTGSNNPFTAKTDRVDMGFAEQVEWLKTKMGIDQAQGILVTVMVDGLAYRSSLTAEQLLGHTLASILQLAGAADLEDSHSVIFIGQAASGYKAKTVPADQKVNFVVNGTTYDDQPGTPMDISKLLNIQVPGMGAPETNFKFNIRSPSGESVTQIFPTDILGVLQEVSDMHGTPGMSLVLSFLNALKQVKDIAPGQTIYIDAQHPSAQIDALLNTPIATIPQGTYLMVFTGSGANIKQVTIPITRDARKRTIKKLLMHLNIVLQTIQDLKLVSNPQGELPVESGSVDFHVLSQLYRIPTGVISSKDHTTISQLFLQLGKRLQTMLEAAPIQNRTVVLLTTFTKRDGTKFSVHTPLGSGDEVARTLSELTLWSLVPEEAVHQHIQHIDMTLEVGGSVPSASSQGPARPAPQPPASGFTTSMSGSSPVGPSSQSGGQASPQQPPKRREGASASPGFAGAKPSFVQRGSFLAKIKRLH